MVTRNVTWPWWWVENVIQCFVQTRSTVNLSQLLWRLIIRTLQWRMLREEISALVRRVSACYSGFDLGPCKYQPSQWTSHQPLTIPAHSIFYSSSSYLKEEMVGTQQCIPGSNTHVYTALPPYPGSSYLLRFLSPNNENDTVIMIMFTVSFVYPRQYL